MAKQFMSVLLAAAAILPGVASAQDASRGWRDGNGGTGGREYRQPMSDQQRADRRAERQAQRDAGQRDAGQRGDWRRPGGGDQPRATDRNGDGRADARGGFDRGTRPDDRGGFRRDDNRPGDRGGFRRDDGRAGWDRNDGRYAQRWRSGDYARWNNGWRQDRRYDWNRYRTYNRGAFRLPRYYAPYGWNYGYRSFGIGVRLAAPLWGQNYWIADPWAYRLPPAYGPYRWVRYYNDAILVDTRTGYTVDVIRDIFW